MKGVFTILVALFLSYISATCNAAVREVTNEILVSVKTADLLLLQAREAQTCADPSLTTTYISAFSPNRVAHVIRTSTDMISVDTSTGTSEVWQFQGPAFLAWSTPQEFTVPFYQLANTPTQNNFVFLPQINGSAPTFPGFTTQIIAGYAYSTQICGSVPLFSASNDAASDHWWTTSQSDHDALIASGTGWVDAGIVFYVLPFGASLAKYFTYKFILKINS